jgi:hypothetical protein
MSGYLPNAEAFFFEGARHMLMAVRRQPTSSENSTVTSNAASWPTASPAAPALSAKQFELIWNLG